MTFLVPSEATLLERSGTYQYIGIAPSGSLESAPVWQLMRLTFSGGDLTEIKWADGNQSSDNAWNDRASKAYS